MYNAAHEDNPGLLTTTEAAEVLGVSIQTVNRWAKARRIREVAKAPGVRGARLYSQTEIEALAADLRAERSQKRVTA